MAIVLEGKLQLRLPEEEEEEEGGLASSSGASWVGSWSFEGKQKRNPFRYSFVEKKTEEELRGLSKEAMVQPEGAGEGAGAGAGVGPHPNPELAPVGAQSKPELTIVVDLAETEDDGAPQEGGREEEQEDVSSRGFPEVSGSWEGYFVVRPKGRVQQMPENFWLAFGCKNEKGSEMKVTGGGGNAYGQFYLEGALILESMSLVMRRVYYAITSGPTAPQSLPRKASKKRSSPPADAPDTPSIAERKGRRQRTMSTLLLSSALIGAGGSTNGGATSKNPRVKTPGSRSGSQGVGAGAQVTGSELIKLLGLGEIASEGAGEQELLRQAITNVEAQSAAAEQIAAQAVPEPEPVAPSPCDESHGSGTSTSASIGGSKKSKKSKDKKAQGTWQPASFDEETGEVYEGTCRGGQRSGFGVCVYASGNMYEGQWRGDKEHGKGVLMTGSRRPVYDGEFIDGKLCGRGTYHFPGQGQYIGDWRDNMRHGRGSYTLPSGATYVGEWALNMRNGRGTMSWPDGSVYEGEWQDDMMHGRGILRLANDFFYDGGWAWDEPDGRGVCVYQDGQKYEGMFRRGSKEGRGTLVFANGSCYEGRFRDDMIDGQGVLHIAAPIRDCSDDAWMIPIQFQSDIERIHVKAGFDKGGL